MHHWYIYVTMGESGLRQVRLTRLLRTWWYREIVGATHGLRPQPPVLPLCTALGCYHPPHGARVSGGGPLVDQAREPVVALLVQSRVCSCLRDGCGAVLARVLPRQALRCQPWSSRQLRRQSYPDSETGIHTRWVRSTCFQCRVECTCSQHTCAGCLWGRPSCSVRDRLHNWTRRSSHVHSVFGTSAACVLAHPV